MKYLILSLNFVFLVTVSFSSEAAKNSKQDKKVEVQCHVELVGGQQTIYLAKVREKRVNKLVDSLVNRKIPTQLSRKKQRVYRAFECKRKGEKFTSPKAKRLLSEMAF
ncbi:MAG: TapY2 family type IVa secretion system protein [Cognaticolwellia sp.]